ncbi:uncharacterized protein LOC117999646 [Mirounga leonina]|uniref:uncharacterized protein LOC117999646 n=1 Tax=Mirounga leonina TaxID=9715 RepID=UPI00156C4137|nr:uncharacterized protein LOC117999646 [Mirounga leonina]XP_034845982.1 uncharacterized protein LOC117999646 [Mirounga leonina]XP_034846687.1 uncharacterized protein LOC117999646 [Mirounga leonina]
MLAPQVPVWPSRELSCWSPGPWAHGHSTVKLSAWPSPRLLSWSPGPRAHGEPAVQVPARPRIELRCWFPDPRARDKPTLQGPACPSRELSFWTPVPRAYGDGVIQVTPFPNTEMGCRTRAFLTPGKPGILWTYLPCATLEWPVCGRAPCPPSVCGTHLPSSIKLVQKTPSLWVPGWCSLTGTDFLLVILCWRVCGLWAPGQPGVWGVTLSTAELVQPARGLRTCGPRTCTVSNDVVIPSPSTYLFCKVPLSLVSVGVLNTVDIRDGWAFNSFMVPVLSWFGGLQSSNVPSAPSGCGLSFPVLSPVVNPEVWEPAR